MHAPTTAWQMHFFAKQLELYINPATMEENEKSPIPSVFILIASSCILPQTTVNVQYLAHVWDILESSNILKNE